MSVAVHKVIVQKWEESECGWGTRPDGYSLHLTEEDRVLFIKKYWNSMPDKAPDEYSRPDGTPYFASVDEEVFAKVKASECGVRSYGRPSGNGGSDGWVRTNKT